MRKGKRGGVYRARSIWLTAVISFVLLTVTFLSAPEVDAAAYPDPLTNCSAHLQSGTGSFSSLSKTSKTIYVEPNGTISGNVILTTENSMPSTNVAPLIGTVDKNWKEPAKGFWTIDGNISTNVAWHTSPIKLTAPPKVGTYYIIFAFNEDFTGAQVASSTSWRYERDSGSLVWNDGNEVANLLPSQIEELQSYGRTDIIKLHNNGFQTNWTLPGDAITVVVSNKVVNEPDMAWVPIAFIATACGFVVAVFLIRRWMK